MQKTGLACTFARGWERISSDRERGASRDRVHQLATPVRESTTQGLRTPSTGRVGFVRRNSESTSNWYWHIESWSILIKTNKWRKRWPIESFFNNEPKEFAKYQNDLRTKRAVERNIEIIGEALSRILKRDETITITNSRKIVDTRNRIIHGYDSVSDDIIWGIVIRHLPILQTETQILLGE